MEKMYNHKAKVVLIGAGPGDPELITLKGIRFLKTADVIIYDYLANDKLLNYCKPDSKKIYVGKKAGHHSLQQQEINKLLIENASKYDLIVRLKGGDPLVFGRGGEELLTLNEQGIEFEIVPGITAGTAVLSYAGIPPTHRRDATSVSFITGHEDPTKQESGLNWPALANIQGTLVFYMGVGNLQCISQKLVEHGKPAYTPVALIRWGTLPHQKTITGRLDNIVTIAEEMKFKPPALIVVGEVIKYRDKMSWFENKPLFGKRIVITRARTQSSKLVEKLEDLGAQVIEFPTIKIQQPESWQPMDEVINNLNFYHWIIFTSVNGVDNFFNRLNVNGFDMRKLHKIQVSAIGPATSERLQKLGIMVDLQPDEFVAESLIKTLHENTKISGKNFLLPRAEEARTILKDELSKAGARVDEVVAYRTIIESNQNNKNIQQIKSGDFDLVTFTSSSTVKNFVELVGKENLNNLNNIKISCIGPITKKTAQEQGFNVEIMPDNYTIPDLVKAIVEYYTDKEDKK